MQIKFTSDLQRIIEVALVNAQFAVGPADIHEQLDEAAAILTAFGTDDGADQDDVSVCDLFNNRIALEAWRGVSTPDGNTSNDALEAAQLLLEGYVPGTQAWADVVRGS